MQNVVKLKPTVQKIIVMKEITESNCETNQPPTKKLATETEYLNQVKHNLVLNESSMEKIIGENETAKNMIGENETSGKMIGEINCAENNTLEQNVEQIDVNNAKISYTVAASYWDNVPATVDGMLGGFAHISTTDINGSNSFLESLFFMSDKPGRMRAVDCGAGIGRVTRRLLQKHFAKVDLVEQCANFAAKARDLFKNNPKIGNILCMGLQDFSPLPDTYDVIWIQWVLGQLPDGDLVSFLKRMGSVLKPNGVIVIKENFVSGDENDCSATILDEEDSSVTRPLEQLIKLTCDAGLTVIKNVKQRKFPKEIFKVHTLALRPTELC